MKVILNMVKDLKRISSLFFTSTWCKWNKTNLMPLLVFGILLWAIFSLPVVIFGQWFPLDLGANFKIVQDNHEFLKFMTPYNGTGRYFPFYWIFTRIEFNLFGTNVMPYYFIQSIIFLLTSFLFVTILYKITGNFRSVILLLVTIYFSSPIAENLNTIGKSEPLICFLIGFILLLFYMSIEKFSSVNFKKIITRYMLISILFSLAIWTKETSISLFGFAFTGLILSFFYTKIRPSIYGAGKFIKIYIYFLLALTVGFVISKIPYFLFNSSQKTGNYTDYVVTGRLVKDNLLFYINQQPDVIMFALISFILLCVAGKMLWIKQSDSSTYHIANYIFVTSLFATGCAYYIALLLWRWPMAYYMLPPAILFKFVTAYGIYIIYSYKLLNKYLRFLVLSVMAVFTIYAALYVYYIASSQIAYTMVYKEALNRYINIPGEKKTLIMESYPFYSEQVEGTWALLLVDPGININVKGIADVLDPSVTNNADILKLLNISQSKIEDNIKNLPKSGDYLLVITGSKLATWFCRGVAPYYSQDSLLKSQGIYDLELVAARTIELPAIYMHIWSHHLVAEKTSIGYKLYRAISDEPKFLWTGRYSDGWIGSKATLKINSNYGRPLVVKLSAPSFSIPNKVIISRDGKVIKSIDFTNADEVTLNLGDLLKVPATFQFEVEHSIVPKKIHLNEDARDLGLRIDLANVTQ